MAAAQIADAAATDRVYDTAAERALLTGAKVAVLAAATTIALPRHPQGRDPAAA